MKRIARPEQVRNQAQENMKWKNLRLIVLILRHHMNYILIEHAVVSTNSFPFTILVLGSEQV